MKLKIDFDPNVYNMKNIKDKKSKYDNNFAKNCVSDILEDLKNRRGLRQEWELINTNVKKEILREWKEIILKNLYQHGFI